MQKVTLINQSEKAGKRNLTLYTFQIRLWPLFPTPTKDVHLDLARAAQEISAHELFHPWSVPLGFPSRIQFVSNAWELKMVLSSIETGGFLP